MVHRNVVTTVTSAAASTLLVELDVVKDELNITGTAQDAKLGRYIAEASLAAQQFCNRTFAKQTYKDEIWPTRDPYPTVNPGGEDPLQLACFPLVAVTEVLEDGETLTNNEDYRVRPEFGQIIRLDGSGYPRKWPAMPISVIYQAGYETIPADVSGKVLRLVTARYFAGGRDPMMMSENIPGVREYRVWVPSGADAGNLPPDVADVLNNYRVPVIA